MNRSPSDGKVCTVCTRLFAIERWTTGRVWSEPLKAAETCQSGRNHWQVSVAEATSTLPYH